MSRLLIIGWLSALANPALAAPVTVWLAAVGPTERQAERSDRDTGLNTHLSWVDLAFPPEPLLPGDSAPMEALRAGVAEGEQRWEDFLVELPVAEALGAAAEAVTVLQSERDREDLIEARLFQGAAAIRGFEPGTFMLDDEAGVYRQEIGDLSVVSAWVDALALVGDDQPRRADFIDGSAWLDFQQFSASIQALPDGAIDTTGVPADVQIWVDGAPVEPADSLSLRPGRHYVHTVRGGVVAARSVVELAPGETVPFPVRVTLEQTEAAAVRVRDDKTTGLGDEVKASLELLRQHYDGALFLSALDGRRVSVVAYAGGAVVSDDQMVTVMVAGDVGAGAVISPLFEEAPDGGSAAAPAAQIGVSVEVGIYNALIAAGLDSVITPGFTIEHANQSETANTTMSAMPQPFLGVGGYALRPTGRKTTFAGMFTIAWNAPAHVGYGGRLILGVPIDDRRNWLRIVAGGSAAPRTVWKLDGDPIPMYTVFARIGFGAAL